MSPEQVLTRTRHLQRSNHSCDYTDFSIRVDCTLFPVHRVFLGRNSSFFHDIIFKENNDGTYELAGYTPDTVEICLLYMYTQELEIGPHNVVAVMELSDHLNLLAAKNQCENFLTDNLNLANCIQMRLLSTQYALAKLSQATNEFILNNTNEVAQTRDIGDMSSVDVKSIASAATIDSEHIWILFKSWSASTAHRICRAVNVVPFGSFDVDRFQNEAWVNGHISACENCQNIAAHQFLGSAKSIPEGISDDDLVFLKTLAKSYGFREVEDLINQYVVENHREILTSVVIETLTHEDLMACVSEIPDMCSPAEFTSMIRWLKNDPDRQCVFRDMFYYVENPDSYLECTFLSSLCVFVGFSESNSSSSDDESNYWFPQHCLFLKELAKRHGCPRTEHHVDECIAGEFFRVSHLPEFVRLSAEDMQKYLSSKSTYDSGADNVWEALMKWVNHDYDGRQAVFEDLFASLRLDEFSEEFIAGQIVLNDLVTDSQKGLARILREIIRRRL